MRKNSTNSNTSDIIEYPKSERVMVGYYDAEDKLRFIITCKPSRDFYFLYQFSSGKFTRLGKDTDPGKLIARYKVLDEIRK